MRLMTILRAGMAAGALVATVLLAIAWSENQWGWVAIFAVLILVNLWLCLSEPRWTSRR